jgi:hypothetical protein
MDVPILTAVISVSGALVGTIVGGCLTMYSNFFLNKRREQAEFRIACRLTASELEENEGLVRSCVEAKIWWLLESEPGTKAWEQHQHVLASYLSYEAWTDVWAAIRGAHFAHNLAVAADKVKVRTIGDERHVSALTSYAAQLQKGRVSLEPYLRKR